MKKTLTLLLIVTSFVTLAQQNPTLPIDPNVRKGKLDNGLTYNSKLAMIADKVEIIGTDSVMGVVPVEKDGSFYIKIKADRPFRIKTLDKNGRMVGEPSGWLWMRPNERRACIGCHEDKNLAPDNVVPLAVKKLPVNVPVEVSGLIEKKVELE